MKDFFKVMGSFAAVLMAGFLVFVWAFVGWWPISTLRGQLAARIDVAYGRYQELAYGLPIPEAGEYARLLKERYGIESRRIAACTPTSSQIDYAQAYDEISMEAAKRKFGRDIFKATYDEVVKSHGKSAESGVR